MADRMSTDKKSDGDETIEKKQTIAPKQNEVLHQSRSIVDTSDERRNRLIETLLNAGYRAPDKNYVPPPLPADKSQWTREDYKMEHYGIVYQHIQHFKPAYLADEQTSDNEDEKGFKSSSSDPKPDPIKDDNNDEKVVVI